MRHPQGPRREYTAEIDEVKPSSTVEGAKARLKNLGDYRGPLDDTADEEFAVAVADFQADHKDTHALEVTGDADQATLGALEDVHGS